MKSEAKLNEFVSFLRYTENSGSHQKPKKYRETATILLMLRLCDQFLEVYEVFFFHHDGVGKNYVFFGLLFLHEEWNCSGTRGSRMA